MADEFFTDDTDPAMGDEYIAPDFTPEYYTAYVSSMPSMEGKVVAITGTTTGTGFVAAKTVAAKGAHVILLNRDSERSVAAAAAVKDACIDEGKVTSIHCDLQDFESVRQAAEMLESQLGSAGLDVLVNNAGVMALQEAATKDGYDVQMQTNHLSHFLLTSLLMPSLKKAAATSGEARIVNHSSAARGSPATPLDIKYYQQKVGELGGDDTPARFERYHQTKLANSTFTFALQGKLADSKSGVKALCAHPGVTPTGLAQTTAADAGGGAKLTQIMATGHALEDGTLPLLSCICNLDAESGDFYGPFLDDEDVPTIGMDKTRGPPAKLTGPEELSRDTAAQKLLWDASEEATGQPFVV